jgi:hypothetical protein
MMKRLSRASSFAVVPSCGMQLLVPGQSVARAGTVKVTGPVKVELPGLPQSTANSHRPSWSGGATPRK